MNRINYLSKNTVLFISSNEPIPTFRRKIFLLNKLVNSKAYLIYWHRKKSLINMPMSLDVPASRINKVELGEPYTNSIRRLILNIQFFIIVYKKLIKIKPNVLHVNNLDIYLVFSFIKIFHPNIKFVLDLIDTREVFFKNIFLRQFARVMLKSLKHVFITSPLYYDEFIKKIDPDFSFKNVSFVPNAPLKTDFEGCSRRYSHKLNIGYFGFLRGKESIEQLCRIIYQLNTRGLKISILFAGIGLEKPLVKSLSQKYDCVHYYGSFDYKEISSLYQQVDIVYSVYLLDHNKKIHMSCRLSESINCERPIIVQDNSYQAQLVRKYDVGYVIQHGNWSALQELLIHIYNNRHELDQKANHCKVIKPEHQFDTYKEKIFKVYNSLFNKKM